MALGAYQSEYSRGNVLNAIAHPNVVNPVAAMGAGWQAYNALAGVQEHQAQQALGGILQQATDPNTGQVSYPMAQRLAAQAGPVVARGMQSMLLNSATLSGQQLEQTGYANRLIGNSIAAALQNPDANLKDAVVSQLGFLRAQGVPEDRLHLAALNLSSDVPTMRRQLQTLQTSLLDPSQATGQIYGTAGVANMPQGAVPYVQAPARLGGAVNTAPGTIGSTLSPPEAVAAGVTFQADQKYVQENPGTTLGQTVFLSGPDRLKKQGMGGYIPPGATSVGGGGVVNSDGTPANTANPPRLLKVPGTSTGTGTTGSTGANTVPAPPGASTGATSVPYTGGGIGSVLSTAPAPSAAVAAPATPLPPIPPAGAVSSPVTPPAPVVQPSVNAPVDTMTPRPRAALQGGVPVAAAAPYAPAVGAGAAPSAAVPGDVNAILQGTQNARASRLGGTQVAQNLPLGPGIQEAGENKLSADLLTAHDNAAANYQQTVFPYTQALHQYGRGVTTAPGADLLNTAKGWLNGVARSVGAPEPTGSTEAMDVLHKYLTQIVSSNPVAAGSDARLAAVLAGNANTGIHELAGADMLKAGVALQRMTVALDNGWHALTPAQQSQYGGSYLNYLRAQAPNIDVRAFARDLYNPAQLKSLNDSIQSGSDEDAQRFMSTLQLARNARLVGGVRAMP